MIRCIGALLLLLVNMNNLLAQAPQYPTTATGTQNTGWLSSPLLNKTQIIYKSNSFAGAKAGSIIAIYLKAGTTASGLTTLANLEIKMGYIQNDTFPRFNRGTGPTSLPNNRVFVTTGLTTVYSTSTYTSTSNITAGAWIKIPLQTPFAYNASMEQNLLVEISQGPDTPRNSFAVLASNGALWGSQILGGRDSLYGVNMGTKAVFGYDLVPTGVNDVDKITEVEIWPNPSAGSIKISYKVSKPIQNLSITAINAFGQQVLSKRELKSNSRSTAELDLSQLPKGVYYLLLTADEEQIVRSIVIE